MKFEFPEQIKDLFNTYQVESMLLACNLLIGQNVDVRDIIDTLHFIHEDLNLEIKINSQRICITKGVICKIEKQKDFNTRIDWRKHLNELEEIERRLCGFANNLIKAKCLFYDQLYAK